MSDGGPAHPDGAEPDAAPIAAEPGAERERREPDPPANDSEPDHEGAAPAHPDPWAHRRGEPRVFAFLWTMYLLVAVAGSVVWMAGTSGLEISAYSPAARIMIVVIAAGAIVLWPMTRLSQERPRRHVPGACLADTLVVVIPVQLVVWPLALLARWPLDVVGAVTGLLAAWGVLAGGLLANALLPERSPAHRRAVWMALLMGLVAAGPLIHAALGLSGTTPPGWIKALSPFVAVYAISGQGPTGATRAVTGAQWLIVLGVMGAGLALWAAAAARSAARRADCAADSMVEPT